MFCVMPNQHSVDKEIMGTQIPRDLAQRVRTLAKLRGSTITSIFEEALTYATRNIKLTSSDVEEINTGRQRAIQHQARKKTRRKSS